MRLSMLTAIPVLFLLMFLLSGCTTTEYTLYLQDVTVKGPLSQPPVHITSDNLEKPLRITPHIAFNANKGRTLAGRIDNHSPVDASGNYAVQATLDTAHHLLIFHERAGENMHTFVGQNLRWVMPSTTIGVDVDYTLSQHVALSFGAGYSTVDGTGLWRYSIGLGLFSEKPGYALRVDGGLQWQELLYEALTAIVKRTSEVSTPNDEVGFFLDRGKDMPRNFYGTITFNTKHQDWPANIFIQIGVSKQSVAKFKPTLASPNGFLFPTYSPAVIVHDQRAEFSSTFFVVTPGVYIDLDASSRILVGTRINMQTEIINSSPANLLLPFVQFEFMM